MTRSGLATLKVFALLFMIPGLAGLIVSASISEHYLGIMPQAPVPSESRVVPRWIHGVTVYQTAAEDRQLNLIEYSSVGLFSIGLVLVIVHLERRGKAKARDASEEDTYLAHESQ